MARATSAAGTATATAVATAAAMAAANELRLVAGGGQRRAGPARERAARAYPVMASRSGDDLPARS